MRKQALAVENSENTKLGGMSTTYAAKGSCPASCPLLKSGACYGNMGPIANVWKMVSGSNPVAIAKEEAAKIDGLSGDRNLRIHTLGDAKTPEAANIVSEAAERYMKRGKRIAFTFTHAWRTVPRTKWGKVSVIASCETAEDVIKARGLGYATALIVPEHKQATAYVHEGLKVIPCPQQTGRSPSCQKCRLCLHDDKLKAAVVTIQFHAHGPSKKVKKVLKEMECR